MQAINLKNLFKINLLLIAMFFTSSAYSQEAYTAENEGWLVDIEEAYQLSKKTGKPILANFTGSDWCGWCKKLTKSVFIHDEFKQWAEKNVVLLELDYPKRKQLPTNIKQQNRSLQQAFGIRGYPTIYVFDLDKNSNGEFAIDAYGKTGYTKTVKEFTNTVEQFLASRKAGE